MYLFKSINYWIKFIVTGVIGSILILWILISLPFIAQLFLIKLNLYWYIAIGSVFLSMYYYLIFVLLAIYFEWINKIKPDRINSNIILFLTYIYFFVNFYTKLKLNAQKYNILFIDIKSTIFFFSIIPVYLKVLFLTLVNPITSIKSKR